MQISAQNIDSLWKVYKNKAQVDTNRLEALNIIAWSYNGNNPDTAIILAEEEIAFANAVQPEKSKKWIADANKTIGASYNNKGDFEKALTYYFKSLKVNEEIKNKKGISACYNNIGLVYNNQSKFPQALEYYLKSLKIKEEIGDKKGLGNVYTNIGGVYSAESNNEKALEYYFKALKIKQEVGNKLGIGSCYNNIGNVYIDEHNYPKALEYVLKAVKIRTEINDKRGLASSYAVIGIIYKDQAKYAEAMEYYLKSVPILKQVGDIQFLGNCYAEIGKLYNKFSDYKRALTYCDSALQMSKRVKDISMERRAYQSLAEIFADAKQYKEAYEYHVKYKALTDSIYNVENSKQLGDLKTKFEVEKKEAELKLKSEADEIVNAEEKKRQLFIIYSVGSLLVVVFVFSVFLFRRFKITQKQKHIIGLQKDEVTRQKHIVEEHQKEIIDSITYAKRLQRAILPANAEINKYLSNNFIYYQPKDIVAGDFYWMEHFNGITFIAAADSTGHGVPGAMVSVVCSNALNRAVKEFGLRDTGKILDKTRELVLETFEKSGEEIKDGMDISLLAIDKNKQQINWSGANNQLWYIADNTLIEIKADKQPIGQTDKPTPFTTNTINLKEGNIFYLMTDGYPDQFGGEKGKKFKYKQLEELLLINSGASLKEQKNILVKSFDSWKGNLEQVDDVTIIGIMV